MNRLHRMKKNNIFEKLRSIELDIVNKDITVSEDINEEALSNTRYISFSSEELLNIGKEELTLFLERMKSSELAKWETNGCIFYCWFDDMARQIRFSTIAGKWRKLPFRCNVKLVNEIKMIIDIAFLYTDEEYFNPDIETLSVYAFNNKVMLA